MEIATSILVLFFSGIVSQFVYVSCDGFHWVKYEHDKINNQRCLPVVTAFEFKVAGPIACSKMTHLNTSCDSFHYNPDTWHCVGCRYKQCTGQDGTYNTSGQVETGLSYFLTARNNHCTNILQTCPNTTSGVYEIKTWKSKTNLKVYCDMETSGGGWTVFQNRFDGSVDFNRNFSEYENGFGYAEGEYWLGLKFVQELADQSSTDIRVVLSAFYNDSMHHGYEEFKGFHLSGTDYTLNLVAESRIFSGGLIINSDFGHMNLGHNFVNAEYGLAGNNGSDFSTFDHDRDPEPENCGEKHVGGFWYSRHCRPSRLNSLYGDRTLRGFSHFGFDGDNPLKTSRMMLRRK